MPFAWNRFGQLPEGWARVGMHRVGQAAVGHHGVVGEAHAAHASGHVDARDGVVEAVLVVEERQRRLDGELLGGLQVAGARRVHVQRREHGGGGAQGQFDVVTNPDQHGSLCCPAWRPAGLKQGGERVAHGRARWPIGHGGGPVVSKTMPTGPVGVQADMRKTCLLH